MSAQGLAAVLAEHEAVGWMADTTGERGWTCLCGEHVGLPPEHPAHVAAAVLAWVETVAGDAAVRDAVAEPIGDAWLDDGHGLACQYRDNPHDVTAATSADAAVAALLAAVRAS